jgi:hypothetical protein
MYPDYGEDRKDAKEAGKDKAYMQSRGYNVMADLYHVVLAKQSEVQSLKVFFNV